METKFKIPCPHCQKNIAYEEEHAGKLANCPTCQGEVQIPKHPPMVPGARAPAPAPASALRNPPATVAAIPVRVPATAPASALPHPPVTAATIPANVPASVPPVGHQLPAAPGGFGLALSDPMDSQRAAMNGIGKGGTLTWGFVMCIFFPIVAWLSFWRGTAALSSLLGAGGGSLRKAKFFDHLEVFVSMSLLVAILFGILLVLNALNGKQAPARAVLFTTGLILLPLSGLALYGSVLSLLTIKSAGAREVVGYLTSFLTFLSLSSLFLLVFAAITSVIGYSRKIGFWLSPGVLMVVFVMFGWLSKLTSEIGNLGR